MARGEEQPTAAGPGSDPAGRAARTGAPWRAEWLWLLTGALLVAASWWCSAGAAVRVLVLWLIGRAVLGRWGRNRLREGQRAVLAGVIAAGFLQLVVFPAGGADRHALLVKYLIPLSALLAAVVSRIQSKGGSEPSRWNSLAVGFGVFFVAVGILQLWRTRLQPAPATLLILAPAACLLAGFSIGSGTLDPARRGFFVRWLVVIPPAIGLVGASQALLMGFAERRAVKAFQGDDLGRALEWNGKALGFNARLRIGAADDHLLLFRAHLLDVLDEPADALAAILRRSRARFSPPDDKSIRTLAEAWLSSAPLENELVAFSHPALLPAFDHLPLPGEAGARTLLLGLFVRNGLFDRLLVYYAQRGLSEGFDFEYLRQCLGQRPRGADPSEAAWAEYFAGICEARLGRRDEARARFAGVLRQWPANHNAQVWLERLAAPDQPKATTARTTATAGRIENAQMLGNHRWGLNVDDALWTGLETRPGRLAFAFEVSGTAAEGEWPVLQVYLDGALVLEQPVRSRNYTRVSWETEFAADGFHRLAVGFPNDINKVVEGRSINRNLYLRRIEITKIARDKAGGGQ